MITQARSLLVSLFLLGTPGILFCPASAKSLRTTRMTPSVSEDAIDELCGNYALVRTNASEKIICQMTLHGNVQSFRVKPPYIAGYTTPLRGEGNCSKAGYFVLNTEAHTLKEGLSEESWKKEMDDIGWTNLQPAAQDYDKPLLGAYRLVRTNAYEVAIVHPRKWSGGVISEIYIHGNVKSFSLRQPYVIGCTTVLRGDKNPESVAKAGFFILNTETDELKEGLTENQWHNELKHIGWTDPQLTKPP